MPLNRRAARPAVSMRTIGTIAAIVAALALIPIVMAIKSANSEPSGQAAPVSAQQGVADNAGSSGSGNTTESNANGAPGRGTQPLTELDKTLLVKVRQAGLWEIPAGRLAQSKGTSEAVKRAGLHLLEGHSKLDQLVREDANILGVQLPDEANPDQQNWVKQMENAKGAEFDRLWANLLRAAHGKIFATIAEVRGATKNDLIRRHARQANQTVLDHMEVLEDTGLIDVKTLDDVGAEVLPKK